MSNCWTISHTYETYVFSRGVAIVLFELVCEEGDPTIIGKVDMSYFDTLRWKIGRQWELNSLHTVETGLWTLGIEKYIKGEEINWRVSVQACSSRNLLYYVLI